MGKSLVLLFLGSFLLTTQGANASSCACAIQGTATAPAACTGTPSAPSAPGTCTYSADSTAATIIFRSGTQTTNNLRYDCAACCTAQALNRDLVGSNAGKTTCVYMEHTDNAGNKVKKFLNVALPALN